MAGRQAVRQGEEAVAALAAAIRAAKAADPLAPVSVIPPSNYSGLWLRRHLARERGLVNVRFLSLARLAEFVGAAAISPPKTRPRTPAVAAEAVRRVLASEPGMFGPVAEHPATAASLVSAFRELEEVPPADLASLSELGGRTADVLRLFRDFEAATGGYYSRADLFRAAATNSSSAATGVFRDLGHIIVYLPGRLSPAQTAFVSALIAGGRAEVLEAEEVTPVASRIVTVTDIDEEVRTVVSLILADMAAGTPAQRIACYYPIEDMYHPILAEQLAAAGIPFNAPSGVELGSTPPGRALLGLLAMDAGAISRAKLIGWIASAPVRDGARSVPVRGWSRISRDAGIAGGPPARWQATLGQYREDQEHRLTQARADGRDGQAVAIERSLASAEWLGRFVEDLASALKEDRDAGWRWWSGWAADLLVRYLDQHELGRLDERATEIVDAVLAVLDELAGLDDLPGSGPVDRRTFARAVEQMLSANTPPATRFGHGVFVAPLALSTGIGMDWTYVLGAVEGVLPAPVREDPLLSERARATAPALSGSRTRLDDLRRSYVAALAGASHSTLSYPVGNLRRGREQLPSRWLLESASAHIGRRIDSRDFERLRDEGTWLWRSASLSARLLDQRMPHNDDSEFELAAMRRSGRDAARRPQVRGGMDVVGQRNSSAFTRHDGNVHAPDVTRGDGITSPTRLETYARCPSRYFLGSVLRVAEFEEPEEVRALSALDRGSIIHDTLEQFYRETAGRDPGPWSDTDRQRLTAIALEHCGRYEQLGRTGGRALWNIERSRLVAELVDYLDADALRSQQFGTRFLSAEVAFGEGDESWPPVEIPLGSGSVRFRGRIDRVDEGPGGTYWVYDYKTGSAYGLTRLDDDPLDSGKRLQLPVYAEAVRGALGATDVRAGYWMVSDANGFGVKELPAGQETRAALVYSLQHIADGIEGGVFIANPGRGNENCTFCPYTAICPSERSRMYVRKIADPAAAPYAALTGDAE